MSRILSHPYLRIALALLLATLAWRATLFLGWVYLGGAYSDYQLDRHIFNAIGVFLLATPAILLLWRFVDRKPWSGLGLAQFGSAGKHFLVGAGIWLVPASVGFLLCLSLGWVHIEMTRPVLEVLAFVPFLMLLVFLYEALPEELIFRGYVYANLSERFQGYSVVFVQSVLFALFGMAIGAADSLERILLFLVVGWIIGSLRMVSGNIWVGIGFHTAFQTIAQLLLTESRGFFVIEGIGTLQVVALGLLPFVCAELLARVVYKKR